jgi:hypothetical protein
MLKWFTGQKEAEKKWWLREHGAIWQEWALLLPGGYVVVYDETGHTVRRGNYGSRGKAVAALKVKGFRPIKRKELTVVSPPQIG